MMLHSIRSVADWQASFVRKKAWAHTLMGVNKIKMGKKNNRAQLVHEISAQRENVERDFVLWARAQSICA